MDANIEARHKISKERTNKSRRPQHEQNQDQSRLSMTLTLLGNITLIKQKS